MNLWNVMEQFKCNYMMWLWTFCEYVIVGYVIMGFLHCWLVSSYLMSSHEDIDLTNNGEFAELQWSISQ